MASAYYPTDLVHEAARIKQERVETDKIKARYETLDMLRQKDLTFGCLWWKTTRKPFQEEAEYFYAHGYWPHDDDPWRVYGYSHASQHRDRFDPDIRKAARIREMCEVSPPPKMICLDDEEVRFLRLSTPDALVEVKL